MPTPYIKKMADKHNKSKEKMEKLWKKAKKIAADEGRAGEYDYITGIFKRMIGEETEAPTNTRDSAVSDTDIVKKKPKVCKRRKKIDEETEQMTYSDFTKLFTSMQPDDQDDNKFADFYYQTD